MSYNQFVGNEYEIFFSDNYLIIKDIFNKHYLRLTGKAMEYIKENAHLEQEQLCAILQAIFSSRTFPEKKKFLYWEFKMKQLLEKSIIVIPSYLFNLIFMICTIVCGVSIGFLSMLYDGENIEYQLVYYIGWVIINILVHEFGHCVLCIKSGRTVHSFGIKLNYCIPMVYVDTSDICMSNLVKKIATSIGGIYFNAILCIITTIFYWISDFAIISFLSKVSFFFVISNMLPFLKLDGYYVVADLLGEFELDRASKRAKDKVFKGKQGITRHDGFLVLYFILKKIFILVVAITIFYEIYIFVCLT